MPFAIAYCIVSTTLLWVFDYPTDEWHWIGLIGYVLLWTSRLIVVNLTVLGLRRLRDYGARVVERFGTDVEVGSGLGAPAKALVFVVLCAVVAVILGLAMTVAALVIFYSGLTPLAPEFIVGGIATLGIGAIALLAFFGFSLMLFAGTEALLNKQGTRVSQIERSEQVVSSLIPASGVARTLDAAA